MIHSGRSMDFAITKQERVSVGLVLRVRNVINAHLVTMDIPGADLATVTMREVNQNIVIVLYVAVMNLDNANAR